MALAASSADCRQILGGRESRKYLKLKGWCDPLGPKVRVRIPAQAGSQMPVSVLADTLQDRAEPEVLASGGVVDHVEPGEHAVNDRPEDRRVIGPGDDDRQRGTESDPGPRDLGPDCHERLLPLIRVVC